MSIRNRVMLATLGLAVVGFVVTLGAQDDKVLIVRDGSVELNVFNSNLKQRDSEKKHKWSKKGDSVQVFEDGAAEEACKTSKAPPIAFDRVELKITRRTEEAPQVNISVVATNEGGWGFGKLEFLMPDDWQFEFRRFKHVLAQIGQTAVPNLRIQQVDITPDGGGTVTSYSPTTPTGYLCVRFRDN